MKAARHSPATVRRRRTVAPDALAVAIMLLLASVIGSALVLHRRLHRPQHPRLSLAEMQRFAADERGLIIDARAPDAFASGHLPRAINLPASQWPGRSRVIDDALRRHRDGLVVVYCGSAWCGEADDLQLALIAARHGRVGVFPGGFEAWKQAGLPVERSR